MIRTPVTLIIFNRPALAERVLKAIASVRPRQLFVVADGPRPGNAADVEKCAAARAVIKQVNWECDVRTHFSDVNLGCGKRPATGISWVFEQADRSIILEDDCVPDPSFFPFCEELLERYRDDERVMQINGSNFLHLPPELKTSYYFSRFPVCWGWATWQRAWRHFDIKLGLWPSLKDTSWLMDISEHPVAKEYWAREFQRAYEQKGEVSYWDHQWGFACWANSGLAIAPRSNLISNHGCGADGTHCLGADDARAELPLEPMKFPLVHPANVLCSAEMDRRFLQDIVLPGLLPPELTLGQRLKQRASRLLPASFRSAMRSLCRTSMLGRKAKLGDA